MSICFKIFISFDRYNGQIGAFEIYRLNETEPSMSFLCKKYYDTCFFQTKVSADQSFTLKTFSRPQGLQDVLTQYYCL